MPAASSISRDQRAVRHIQHQRAGSIRHVDGPLAGEAEADVVLGQHDCAHALPVLRLVLAHPQQFCQSEIGERRIAGELDERSRPNILRQVRGTAPRCADRTR